jgi:methyltransferase-like protein/SAM-dependent methyltransferase
MSNASQTTYDEIPYASNPFMHSHPDRLATVATLFGMSPCRVDRCRVLELGCASGGNLIPMAQSFPESTFVGIDLSARQVADGHRVVEAIGLKNIELKRMSLLDVTPEFGQFDYVICHGVYSWVPPVAQEKILEICRHNTTPQGVAYVSYNTYPGWHMRGMIRDMMLYHASHFAEPLTKVAQARALLDFLAQAVGKEGGNPYGLLLKSELETLRKLPDSYLLHEFLEEHNEPLYFYQFIERAKAKGLRYLGEAELGIMVSSNFPPEIESVLKRLAVDIIHTEQYMDFLRNRTFRQTLLCHEGITPKYQIDSHLITAFHVASPAKPAALPVDLASPTAQSFTCPNNVTLTAQEPIVKAALLCLGEVWPQAIPFTELRDRARARLQPSGPPSADTTARDTEFLGPPLLMAYASATSGVVQLSLCPSRFTVTVSENPAAAPLARLQATAGYQVTNQRHEVANLDEFGRQVLRHLDGKRNRWDLLDVLVELAAQDVIRVNQGDQRVTDPKVVRKFLDELVDKQLQALARFALLVS